MCQAVARACVPEGRGGPGDVTALNGDRRRAAAVERAQCGALLALNLAVRFLVDPSVAIQRDRLVVQIPTLEGVDLVPGEGHDHRQFFLVGAAGPATAHAFDVAHAAKHEASRRVGLKVQHFEPVRQRSVVALDAPAPLPVCLAGLLVAINAGSKQPPVAGEDADRVANDNAENVRHVRPGSKKPPATRSARRR